MLKFQPIDNSRDKYRRYIESTGLLEMITKSLAKIMGAPESEWPENPTEMFCGEFGATLHAKSIIDSQNSTIEQYKIEVEKLKTELDKERAKHRETEPVGDLSAKEVSTTVVDEVVLTNCNNAEQPKTADQPIEEKTTEKIDNEIHNISETAATAAGKVETEEVDNEISVVPPDTAIENVIDESASKKLDKPVENTQIVDETMPDKVTGPNVPASGETATIKAETIQSPDVSTSAEN